MPPTSAQRAGDRALSLEDAGARLLEIVEHPLAEPEQRRAGGRDADLAAKAQEQLLVQLFFEQQDLRLTADCDRCSCSPALVNEPVWATARRISSCRRSTARIL